MAAKKLWPRIERLAELARLIRADVTTRDPDADATWAIADYGAELQREAQRLALLSGCGTHIRVNPSPPQQS